MASQQELSFAIRAINEASKTLRDVQGDIGKLGGEAEKTKGPLSGMGGALGDVSKIAGGFVIGSALTQAPALLSDLSHQAAQLDLQAKKVNTVFGDQAGVMKTWASQSANAMGLTKSEALGLAAGLADLLIPMGMTREQAADLSQKTIGLSGALAEWSGGTKTAAEVSDILTKAYLGETDGLKSLGISISAADIEARLAAKGQLELEGAARQQAEAMAIQEMIFEKSTDAQAAYADGADSAARKQGESAAKVREWKESIATGLQPAFEAVTTFIATQLIPAVDKFSTEAGPKIKEFAEDVKKYWESDIKPALDNLRDAWEKLSPVILPILHEIDSVLETVAKSIALSLGIVIDLLSGDFSGAWEKAKEIVDLNVGLVKDTIGNLVDFVEGLVPLMLEAATHVGSSVMDGLKAGLSAAGGFATDVAGEILGALKSMVNAFIIDPINRALEFHIGGSILGKDWGVNIDPPDIPHLASGGIVMARPGGTLALLGEGGRDEAVVPLGPGASGLGGVHIHIDGNVYGVDHLAYELDRALKRMGQPGLVT